jgi:hypothetical protein
MHNEELHALYFSPNVTEVTNRRRMKRIGHVAHTRTTEMHTRFWSGNLNETDHL